MKINNFILTISGKDDYDGYVDMSHNESYTIDLHNLLDRRCTAEVSVDGKSVGLFRLSSHGSLKLEHPSGDHGKFTFYRLNSKEFHSTGLDKVNKDDLGLVSVVFKPEKKLEKEYVSYPVYPPPRNPWPRIPPRPNPWEQPQPYYCDSGPIGSSEVNLNHFDSNETKCCSVGTKSLGPSGQSVRGMVSAGGTGLSGHSGQNFHTVNPLDYDSSDTFVEINIRLVYNEQEGKPRELKDANVRKNKRPLPI